MHVVLPMLYNQTLMLKHGGLHPGKAFKESAMSSSDIKHMLRKHLKAAGLNQKLTPHGLRRGRMQHDYYNVGKKLENIMQRSQIRTVAVGRRYLDPIAHIQVTL